MVFGRTDEVVGLKSFSDKKLTELSGPQKSGGGNDRFSTGGIPL